MAARSGFWRPADCPLFLVSSRRFLHGQIPQACGASTRAEELAILAGQIRRWIEFGIEPRAIGVAARSGVIGN